MSLITSTLKIYPASFLTPRRNFYVDDIENYLATKFDLLTIEIDNFQYIKHGLNITIKVDISQIALDYSLGDFFRYCSIINSNESQKVYYFIMDKKWLGQSTLQLELSMDTINTFRLGTSYSFDDKTKINRQHFDRFEKIASYTGSLTLSFSGQTSIVSQTISSNTNVIQNDEWIGISSLTPTSTSISANANIYSWTFDGTTGEFTIVVRSAAQTTISYYATMTFDYPVATQYYRKIHLASEGINPMLYGQEIDILDNDGTDWYLLYTGASALSCYAIPSTSYDVITAGNSTVTYSDLTVGYYYYILFKTDGSLAPVTLTINSTTAHTGRRGQIYYLIRYYRSGSDIIVQQLKYVDNGIGGLRFIGYGGQQTASSFTLSSTADTIAITYLNADSADYSVILAGTKTALTLSNFASNTLAAIDTLDRTSTDHVKLIKLPYKPFNELDGVVSADWIYDSTTKWLLLKNLDSEFISNQISTIASPIKSALQVDLSSITISDLRSADNESKLFHSDYYQPKFVYDSFTFVFNLETIDISSYYRLFDTYFTFTFACTNTINSRFLFTFPNYIVTDYLLEDFNNILYVARNNEVPLYNTNYADYIKNGYNYDVKSKERQELGQWVTFGLTSVGAVASFAASGMTAGISAAAGISLATSSMAQLVSAVNTTAQTEANQAQKMHQLRQQRANITNADDVDLMTQYCSNKAKLMLYTCSPRMKAVLNDLFFYTGYVDGKMGVPDTTSRIRFNFVSCEPVFTGVKNIPEDILNDMELKYNAGVTFIHHYNGDWDMEQKYENWETSLFQED